LLGPALQRAIEQLRATRFAELTGARLSLSVPVGERLLNELAAAVLPPNLPVRDVTIRPRPANTLQVRARVANDPRIAALRATLKGNPSAEERAAFDKLRPGAPIVLETINPACWFAFFESYIRDLTHVRPVHPDTLKFLLIATGFQRVEIAYRAPYPEGDKLQTLAHGSGAPTSFDDMIETLNANVEKINRLLFTYLDYAAIGRRG